MICMSLTIKRKHPRKLLQEYFWECFDTPYTDNGILFLHQDSDHHCIISSICAKVSDNMCVIDGHVVPLDSIYCFNTMRWCQVCHALAKRNDAYQQYLCHPIGPEPPKPVDVRTLLNDVKQKYNIDPPDEVQAILSVDPYEEWMSCYHHRKQL